MRHRLAVALLLLMLAACGSRSTRIVVAAGTTVADPGLMDRVAATYERTHPGVEVSVVGESTARVFVLARNGEADVTVTHHPEMEEDFRDQALIDRKVFESRFLLVGPSDHEGGLDGSEASDALAAIADAGWTFVARNDGSGTSRAERLLWERAGIDPDGSDWYLETGQGMGLTLQVASQRAAFTIAEEGTFLESRRSLDLVEIPVRDMPPNIYVAMAVASSDEPDAATAFVEWLASSDGFSAVIQAQTGPDGVVYRPIP
jgi:tungstate transport system substrate-binding protein